MSLGIPGFLKKIILSFWPLSQEKPAALYTGPEKHTQRRFLAEVEILIDRLPEEQKNDPSIRIARANIDQGLIHRPNGRKETVDQFTSRLWRENNNVRAKLGVVERIDLQTPASRR